MKKGKAAAEANAERRNRSFSSQRTVPKPTQAPDTVAETLNQSTSLEQWTCASTFEAHSDRVCSMVSNENILFTASNKTFKVWSLDSMSVISEVPAHTSYIRAMTIMPESNVVLTSCDKLISIWDTISLSSVGKLAGHKDEIHSLHTFGNYLYSGGNGSSSAGALFVWDLRRQATPILELERGMD
jgi:hypothetical protein